MHHDVSFVVDLHLLDDFNDIKADASGIWKRKGSPVTYISVHKNPKEDQKWEV